MNDLRDIVRRASLAPSVHNVQGTRWRQEEGEAFGLYWDDAVSLTVGDPTRRDAGLSLGAAAEATVLALSEAGQGAEVGDRWAPCDAPLIPGAVIRPSGPAPVDPLAPFLKKRFTWRHGFAAGTPQLAGWVPEDTFLFTDHSAKAWFADENDRASLRIMRSAPFRRELLRWMRLSRLHPRRGKDGMDRAAMGMTRMEAVAARLVLGPLWPLVDRLGASAGIVAEAEKTRSAQVIAVFHRPEDESPVVSGRAYLRLWLEATRLGYAGWPMAALSDDPASHEAVAARSDLPQGRRIVQVIRFGLAPGPMPPRARRPLDELILPA